MAVVHQRISQLNSSGLMNIESSHKLTRSGDTASGCIEGVNMEDYQVGVVGGRRLCTSDITTFGNLSCCQEASLRYMYLGVYTISVHLVDDVNNTHLFIGNHDNSSPRDSTRDIELERCGAYEIVRLSKQKVVTTFCLESRVFIHYSNE